MESILDRIAMVAARENISVYSIERTIGTSKGVLARAIKNNKDIQAKWLSSFIENYPRVNSEWLLTGKGNMLKTVESVQFPVQANLDGGIPLIPVDAMTGALTGGPTLPETEYERYVIPAFKGADFLIHVRGESMYPKYSSGDIIAGKSVSMSEIFFQWNKVYILNTSQGVLIKRIKSGSDNEHVLIASDNDSYEPFELPRDAIYSIAIVIGVIRLE